MNLRKRISLFLCILAAMLFWVLVAPHAGATGTGLQSFAQADRVPLPARIKGWTQAQWNAAKKRWAKDREKFAECVKRVDESKELKRLSYHRQTDFIQRCMQEKS